VIQKRYKKTTLYSNVAFNIINDYSVLYFSLNTAQTRTVPRSK